MKRILLIFFLAFCFQVGFCQVSKFSPIGPSPDYGIRAMFVDTTDHSVYIGGGFLKIGNTWMRGLARWDGKNWNLVGKYGIDFFNNPKYDTLGHPGKIFSIIRYKDKIYISGEFKNIDGDSIVATGIWDGTKWIQGPKTIMTKYKNHGIIYQYRVYNNDLYAIGRFDSIEGIYANCIARFDGSQWSAVTSDYVDLTSDFFLYNMEFYHGELYVIGNFIKGPNEAKDIARLVNGKWEKLGQGLSGYWTDVEGICVYKDTLWVGGFFYRKYGDPGNGIAKWDGKQWIDAGPGTLDGTVICFKEYRNELYIGGYFHWVLGNDTLMALVKYDGKTYTKQGVDSITGMINFLSLMDSSLYIGGDWWIKDTNYYIRVGKLTLPPLISDIKNVGAKSKFIIFPNPTRDFLHVLGLQGPVFPRFELFDLSGRMIEKGKLDYEMHVSHLHPGKYLLKLETGESLQFVKE